MYKSMATRGRQWPRPSAPCRFFSWPHLPTPGPPPTHSRHQLQCQMLGKGVWVHNLLNKPKLTKKVPTCRNLGARRGRGVHDRLPVKIGSLPGPALKCVEAVDRWGALGSPGRAGDRWRPCWRPQWRCSKSMQLFPCRKFKIRRIIVCLVIFFLKFEKIVKFWSQKLARIHYQCLEFVITAHSSSL